MNFFIKLFIFLSTSFFVFSFFCLEKDPVFSQVILLSKKTGIYFNEYELLVKPNQLDTLKLNLNKSFLKYRLNKYLGKWYLQVNKSPVEKIKTSIGQRGFYCFFKMNGKLFLVDALKSIYIINKNPEFFCDQIEKNVENVELIYLYRKQDVTFILREIYKRCCQIIHCARNISEYTKFNSMNSIIYVIKDNLISAANIQEIIKNGSKFGVFLIVWGGESKFYEYNNIFESTFLFKGNGLLQNNVLSCNECLYLRNSFVQRIIIDRKI